MNEIKKETLKKGIFLLFVIIFCLHKGQADEFGAGLKYGHRRLKDPILNEIYGNGFVFNPYLRYSPVRLFSFEVSYEGGYKKNGLVGIYSEDSTLKINGFELSAIFQYHLKQIAPYFKFGYGYYSYKQLVDSEFVRLKVNHHQSTYIISTGADIYVYKGFYLAVEVKYVPLKVRPFDTQVDLGGLRYLIGLGFKLGL